MANANYYNAIASIYDQARWMTEPIAEDVADVIVALVGATPNTAFLEPGVGTGLNVLPLVKRGYAVTGIDISQEMLDQFRQKLQPMLPNLTLVQADASTLPFPGVSFDTDLGPMDSVGGCLTTLLTLPWQSLKPFVPITTPH